MIRNRTNISYRIADKSKPLPFEMSGTSALEIAMTLDEAKAACQSSYTNSSPLVVQAAEEGSKSIANGKERTLPIEALGLAMASCANTYTRLQKEDTEDKLHLRKNETYGESNLLSGHIRVLTPTNRSLPSLTFVRCSLGTCTTAGRLYIFTIIDVA